MTLNELNRKFHTRPNMIEPNTIYVFHDEDSADNWYLDKYAEADTHDYELVAVLKSDFVMDYTMKEEWCNAEVVYFYAVEPDVLIAVVEGKS